jgi:hypothetical protein
MDIEAKHTSNGITEWRYHDVPQKMWKITPLRATLLNNMFDPIPIVQYIPVLSSISFCNLSANDCTALLV